MSESKGREKAKENTFIKLGTRPEDYRPGTPLKICRQADHCQLCGQVIGYDFLLEHKSNSDKNLYVGSDCILKFIETYLPNIVGTAIRKLQLEMEREIEEAKAVAFAHDYPTFSEDVKKLNEGLFEALNKYKTSWEFRSGKKKLDIFEIIADVTTDYRKKKYTTKPKTEKIYEAIKMVESGRFEEKVKEHTESMAARLTIAEEIEKDAETKGFYDLYLKNAQFINWDKAPTLLSPALSKLEKEVFLSSFEYYADKRTRIKKKLNKSLSTVIDKLKTAFLDPIRVSVIEPEDRMWGYYPNKEILSQYKYYVDPRKDGYSNPYYAVRSEIDDFGLKGIRDLAYEKDQNLIEKLGAGLDGVAFNNRYLFRTEEDAHQFEKALFAHFEAKIESLKDYAKSEEYATEDFH